MSGSLLKKLLKKDRQSERILFEMYYQRIYNIAYFMIRDRHLAQDVVQDTFLKAFKQMHTLKDGEKMGAWLGTIATKTSLDYLRKFKRRNDFAADDVYLLKESSKASLSPSVEEIVEENCLRDLVRQNMAELKPEYKQVLILKYDLDLKDEEIAHALEITTGAVKSRLHRAKIALRTRLKQHFNEEGGDDVEQSLDV